MKTRVKKFGLALLVAGISLGSLGYVDNYFEISKNLDIFVTLFKNLNIYYVDETEPGKLIKESIDGMLESLDPYTTYIPESEMEDHRFSITGKYGGIGSLIRKRGEKIIIAEPYEDYPAHKAGLIAGDILLEVNGTAISGKNTSQVSKVLKGQAGTSVKILVEREGKEKPFEVELVRDEIKINPVPYFGMLDDNFGYIRLSTFTSKASEEIKKGVQELKKEDNLKGLVLDLRSNPGGLLREAVNIVNLFVGKGDEIVSTRGKLKDWDKVHRALNTPLDEEIPLIILVNRSSASASEIVAGALQDLDRAVVIGQKTFGKGLVQQTLKLTYNAQLKVTTAKYFIPSGRCIQALDYTNRNEDGSVGKVPDSLITEFSTRNGRPVYDGGGIEPDISVSPQKGSRIGAKLMNKMLIFDYASKYKREHKKIDSPKDFQFTDEDYEDFKLFLVGKDYDYTTRSEAKLKELKKIATDEEYFQDAQLEFEAFKTKLTHNNEDDLNKFKEGISDLITREIMVRYYFQKGRIEAMIQYNDNIKKALEVLGDSATYNAILAGNHVTKVEEEKKEDK
ncbi:MAG TPA: S41 family peptidase [Flavobacteriales bacterium]|nr:S41 family peptidase [Flavobacteriales bacterium]